MLEPASVHLVVTSPPYPMISMWDEIFRGLDASILPVEQWTSANAMDAFEKMHVVLDAVWAHLFAVVCEGGIVAINIGDATRSVEGNFQIFPNGARTTLGMCTAGFRPLPNIYWKKPTNGPNAFLGSGFQSVNVYVTVDCEHILLFRKGSRRAFTEVESVRRRACEFTMQQRNAWFTQTWVGITGARQVEISGRRNAAFPDAIPERLIRMYSIIGDVVLDPFCGTGTTVRVAKKLQRAGVGVDIDADFVAAARQTATQDSVTDYFARKPEKA